MYNKCLVLTTGAPSTFQKDDRKLDYECDQDYMSNTNSMHSRKATHTFLLCRHHSPLLGYHLDYISYLES